MVSLRGTSGGSDRRYTCNQLTGARPAFFSCYLNVHALLYLVFYAEMQKSGKVGRAFMDFDFECKRGKLCIRKDYFCI